MTPIPPKLRKQLSEDPWYKNCCLGYFTNYKEDIGACEGRVQFHHVFIYAGQQIQEAWAILPVCEHHHDQVKTRKFIKEELERISLMLATAQDLREYPNEDWKQLKKYLNRK